jgi:hypothetical protein
MTLPGGPSNTAPTGSANDYRVTRGVLIIVGSIAAFLGLFIMVGPDDSSIGLGGQVSWEVGEIAPAWGYGLLLGGAAALACGLFLVARARRLPKDANAGGWHDVMAHAVVFLVVNTIVWAQDIATGGGVDYAYWITVPWGVGLLVQAAAQAAAGGGAHREREHGEGANR